MNTASPHTNGNTAPPATEGWHMLPITAIHPSKTNPRKHFDETALAELAESIRSKGVIEPLIVRPSPFNSQSGEDQCIRIGLLSGRTNPTYELVAGERRLRAAELGGLHQVPAIVRNLSDKDALEIQVIENEQRADTTPLEKAAGYARLIDHHGETVDGIAQRVGKSPTTIRELLRLRQAPESLRTALDAGEVSASVVGLVARIPDPASREKCAEWVLTGHEQWSRGGKESVPWSYRDVKDQIHQKYMIELKQAPFNRKSLELVPEAGACDPCPKRAGNLAQVEPDVYGGVRADVCTDPGCYQKKVAAWQSKVQADAEVLGQKVLTQQESEKLFPYGDYLAYNAPYFDLKEQCQEDRKAKKPRSYKQLLEPHCANSAVVIAFDQQGQMHRLIHKDVGVPILRDTHQISVSTHGRGGAEQKAEQQAQRDETRKKNAIERERNRLILEGVATKAEMTALHSVESTDATLADILYRLILPAFQGVWTDHKEIIFARYNCKGKTVSEKTQLLVDQLVDMQAPQLFGLLVEVFAAKECLSSYGIGDLGKKLLEACDVDPKACERKAKETLQAKAKDSGKPKAKKAKS